MQSEHDYNMYEIPFGDVYTAVGFGWDSSHFPNLIIELMRHVPVVLA